MERTSLLEAGMARRSAASTLRAICALGELSSASAGGGSNTLAQPAASSSAAKGPANCCTKVARCCGPCGGTNQRLEPIDEKQFTRS